MTETAVVPVHTQQPRSARTGRPHRRHGVDRRPGPVAAGRVPPRLGRDCWCDPGENNRCLKRFDQRLGTLPDGYDHNYVFSHVCCNLESTDLQAALGLTQLARIEEFGAACRRNWAQLRAALDRVPVLLLPEPTPGADPRWFGFVLTVLPDAGFTRRELVAFLEDRKIATRGLFGGTPTRHPAYADAEYRVSGELTNSDVITDDTFWAGVHPGLTAEMIGYITDPIIEFAGSRTFVGAE